MITLISEFHCIFHFERNGTRIISDGIWFEIKCKNGMKIQKKISLLHSCLFLLFIKIVLFFFFKLYYHKRIYANYITQSRSVYCSKIRLILIEL